MLTSRSALTPLHVLLAGIALVSFAPIPVLTIPELTTAIHRYFYTIRDNSPWLSIFLGTQYSCFDPGERLPEEMLKLWADRVNYDTEPCCLCIGLRSEL